MGSYMSHISCIGFISLCSFKKWFIFMMIDTYAHWQGSLVAQQQGGLLEQCDARAVGWWCSEVMGQWVQRCSLKPACQGFHASSVILARAYMHNVPRQSLLKGKCVVFLTIKSDVNYCPLGNHLSRGQVLSFLLHKLQTIPRLLPFSTHTLMSLASPLPSLTYRPISRPPDSAP